MAKTRWFQERQREPYYRKAKKEGYRARSAYKLQQIDERFTVARKGEAVADLGAAPGGWSQVLIEMVGPEGFVVGVDLQRIRPMPGAKFLQGDFLRPETRERLAALLAEAGRKHVDAVTSDMAPEMSGNYELDQLRSVQLAEMALAFCDLHLRKGGAFVCKVFEGADFPPFRDEMKKRFKRMHQFHPPASRKSSSEIYMIGKHFLGVPGPGAQPKAPIDKDDEAPIAPSRDDEE